MNDDDAAAPEPVQVDETPSFGRHPVLVYTLKRSALLVVVGAVLYLLGLRGAWLIVVAFLISGVIAMVALKDSREGASYGITGAVQRANHRIEESARAEDIADIDDDLGPTEPDRS